MYFIFAIVLQSSLLLKWSVCRWSWLTFGLFVFFCENLQFQGELLRLRFEFILNVMKLLGDCKQNLLIRGWISGLDVNFWWILIRLMNCFELALEIEKNWHFELTLLIFWIIYEWKIEISWQTVMKILSFLWIFLKKGLLWFKIISELRGDFSKVN